jgi:Transposase IS66 family
MGRPERAYRPECTIRQNDRTGIVSLRGKRYPARLVHGDGERNSHRWLEEREPPKNKRLTNTPVLRAGSVLKCSDDRKNGVVSAQATYAWRKGVQSVAFPSSALSKACQYTLALWKKLTRFLEYPELGLSTNLAENSMRPVALGRKNWLQIGSPQAGPKVAAILSVCRLYIQNCCNVGTQDCHCAHALRTPLLRCPLGQKTSDSAPRGRRLLLSLYHGAVGRSCFPCPRIIDPGVAANYSSRPMRAPEFGVIGKCVM